MKILSKNNTHHLFNRMIIVVIIAFGLLNSCVTNKKTIYFQENDKIKDSSETFAPEPYRIQVNDNLFIRVTTPDPRMSEMFNTIPLSSPTVVSTEQSVDLLSYSVQLDGTVAIPYLGSIAVVGKTVAEVREIFQEHLADYVTDAAITVKLVNNYLSILGEVRVPGRYPIYKEQMNILQALAMAGDIEDYGNRFKIRIIRKTGGETIMKEFDITDRSIVDSEFYYVMPNDVIYAEPMKGKFFAMSSFPFALILQSITTFLVVWTFIQR